MSRNNLILVVKDKRHNKEWYYVFANLDADCHWNARYVKKLINNKTFRRTKSRATALVLAHNKQKRMNTEYGVREMTITF